MLNAIATLLAGLIPQSVKDWLAPVLDRIEGLLNGEPARIIGYGSAVIVYLVAAAFDRIPDVTFNVAVQDAVAMIGLLVTVIESIRHFVFSPNTVSALTTPAEETPDGGIG